MNTAKWQKDAFINKGSEIERELLEIFPKDSEITIADIGACDGLSSIIYARMFPKAKIIGFEPRSDNCLEAMDNFREYNLEDRTEMYQVCLGDVEGKVDFWKSKGQVEGVRDWDTGNKSSSVFPPNKHRQEHPWCEFDKETVDMRRLDDYKFKIHFIHIDVQGAELKVFWGARETLKRTIAVWCEVSTIELYKNQPLKNEVIEFMAKERFVVKKDTCAGKSGDCLFVKG
jgi:2-O-methyltransferase